MSNHSDIKYLLEFYDELKRVTDFKLALKLADKLQNKPFKFSKKSKDKMIKDIIASVKRGGE